ncbi:hypothetical protein Lser_V15G06123 [Lactuca serriola]
MLPSIIHGISIPSGNTANLSKNREISMDEVVMSRPNSDLKLVKSPLTTVSPSIANHMDSSAELAMNGDQIVVDVNVGNDKILNEEDKGLNVPDKVVIPGVEVNCLRDGTMDRGFQV